MTDAFSPDFSVLGSAPAHWDRRPLWTVMQRRDVSNRPDAELLSVYRDHGVVQKKSRDDNYNKPSEDLSNYKYVRPGDLVLNKMKTWQGSLAVSQYEGIVSPAYYVCAFSPIVNPKFAHYLLRSRPYIYLYQAASQGIRPNQWDLPYEEFARIPMLLPSFDEQQRITNFLDTETAKIDSLAIVQEKARSLLLERRTAQVIATVTGNNSAEAIPSKLAWVDVLPASWHSIKLGNFARMGSGHTPSRSHPEWWVDCSIPWITTGEVSQIRDDRLEILTDTRECISEVGMANSSAELHPRGTVVLCRTASAGYSAVMGEDMATSQDFVTWTCGPLLDPFYLLWCLRAMRADLLGRLAMGSTHKTIYVPDLQMLRIPLPPITEQQKIVSSIRSANAAIDATVDAIDRQLVLLAERRHALITAAVTGEITV